MNAKTLGAHHIGLTVPDIQATRQFFTDVLGFEVVGDKPDYPAVFVSDGTVMLTLWQAEDPASATPFNRRKNIGLHHLALGVKNAEVLREIYQVISTRADVSIEFTPEALAETPLQHMMCEIPGGVRLELITVE